VLLTGVDHPELTVAKKVEKRGEDVDKGEKPQQTSIATHPDLSASSPDLKR